MADKLSIINDALAATANNLVVTEGEDSDEWDVASRAYDSILPELIERHPWNFATTTEVISQSGTNPSQVYDYAYTIPTSIYHVIALYQNGSPITYEIVDRKACTNFNNDQYSVYVKGTRNPSADNWPPGFARVLTLFVEAGCLRGLNEDWAEADKREARGEVKLAEARTRADRQEPKNPPFRSTMLARRRGLR